MTMKQGICKMSAEMLEAASYLPDEAEFFSDDTRFDSKTIFQCFDIIQTCISHIKDQYEEGLK